MWFYFDLASIPVTAIDLIGNSSALFDEDKKTCHRLNSSIPGNQRSFMLLPQFTLFGLTEQPKNVTIAVELNSELSICDGFNFLYSVVGSPQEKKCGFVRSCQVMNSLIINNICFVKCECLNEQCALKWITSNKNVDLLYSNYLKVICNIYILP